MCVSLIELNAQEDEWFVAIETLQEEKRNAQNQALELNFYIIKIFNILIKSIPC
jgi:hypothetical protein